jgi:hypothetical protein
MVVHRVFTSSGLRSENATQRLHQLRLGGFERQVLILLLPTHRAEGKWWITGRKRRVLRG